MSRSRSSFDLKTAIATAATLSAGEGEAPVTFGGVSLVSFAPPADPARGVPRGDASGEAAARPAKAPGEAATSAQAGDVAHPLDDAHSGVDSGRRPPKLPDLTNVPNPIDRCDRILDWLLDAIDASDVFIADAAGLAVAGTLPDAEARLAAASMVASSVRDLAQATPGSTSPLFEMHVGDGPFFQLIGFDVAGAMFLVGFMRATPLSYRQAHAVRLACRHALSGFEGAARGAVASPGHGARP